MRQTFAIMTVVLAALWCAGCEGQGGAEETRDSAAATPAGATAQRLIPLGISLPKPMFKCTPVPIPNEPNLEDSRRIWKRRGPFLVPPGTTNMALGKLVTSGDTEPIIGELEFVTDGEKRGGDGYYVELAPGRQWVQIDLMETTAVYAVLLWHYHAQIRAYRDVVVQISHDPDFVDSVTVFNNDHDNTSGFGIGRDKAYLETYQGKLIDCKGFTGRYVRLWSRENSTDEGNHYIEVEVHGRAVDAPPAPIDQPLPKLEITLPVPMLH